MDTLENQVLDGKYKLKRKLGEGGMGSVWLARHLGTGRPVALKLIVPRFTDNTEFISRFQREARAAGLLRHPNIVDVTDFGFAPTEQGPVAYLVMEYLQGVSLSAVISEEQALPLGWVVDILEQVCLAVDYAHQHDIVHRDLKPDNICLLPNERGGFTIKVLDFGLARLDGEADDDDEVMTLSDSPAATPSVPTGTSGGLQRTIDQGETVIGYDAEATIFDPTPPAQLPEVSVQPSTPIDSPALTQVGTIMGTPSYMSPEQCRGVGVGAASDIYSLGVIGYQMMAGHLPFQGTMLELIKQHLNEAPPPLKSPNRRIPKKLARTISSALAKDPAERPPSGEAFASLIRASWEGPARLLQRAIVVYSEHFTQFLLASCIIGLPALAMEGGLLAIDALWPAGRTAYLDVILSSARMVWGFFEFSLLLALTMRLVAQFTLSPLKPISLRQVVEAFRKRYGPLVKTVFLINLFVAVGSVLAETLGGLTIAQGWGWLALSATALAIPVTMVEGLVGWPAVKRGLYLARRVWPGLLLAVALQFGLPLAFSWVLGLETSSGGHHLEARVERDLEDLIGFAIGLIIMPLVTIMLSLVYLKARQAGGEPLADVLAQFEQEEQLYSDWQARLHSSLQLNSSFNSRKSHPPNPKTLP